MQHNILAVKFENQLFLACVEKRTKEDLVPVTTGMIDGGIIAEAGRNKIKMTENGTMAFNHSQNAEDKKERCGGTWPPNTVTVSPHDDILFFLKRKLRGFVKNHKRLPLLILYI